MGKGERCRHRRGHIRLAPRYVAQTRIKLALRRESKDRLQAPLMLLFCGFGFQSTIKSTIKSTVICKCDSARCSVQCRRLVAVCCLSAIFRGRLQPAIRPKNPDSIAG